MFIPINIIRIFLTILPAFIVISFAIVRKCFKPVHKPKNSSRKPCRLPPGPQGFPLIGNLLEMKEARRDSDAFVRWLLSHASFGEMATLQMGSKTWVLLNSSRVVHEIIAKRGSITSERPHFPVASGLVSRGQRTVIQQTAQWTEGRRVMHHLLNNSSALKQYGKWIELESIDLLAAYLHKPHRWYSHHYRYSNSVIHRIVLGHRLLRSTPELNDFQRVGVQFIQSINSSIIDFFPQLAALPTFLKPWYKHWNNVGQSHYEVFQTWWKPVKQAVTNGTAPSSFVRDTLLHKDTRYSGNDEQAMYVAMSIIGAGSDNPRLAMNTFVMAALCYPSAFQKARNEIDCICDFADRLPTIDDIDRMPFICAMVKEVLRWRPVMPIIPQHQLTEDLEFEQYHFPSGTDFLINFAAICQEADNPGDFKPERWLGDGHERSIIQGLWQFGGGRRICVGYKVAQLELFLAFSRLIYCFDYTAAGSYDSHHLQHHVIDEEPFPVAVTMRSAKHEQLIVKETVLADVHNVQF